MVLSYFSSGLRPLRRILGSVFVLAGLLSASGASALTIADTNPIYFLGSSQFGFAKSVIDAAGLPIAATSDPTVPRLTAGNAIFSPQLSIEQNLGPVYTNPQAAYQNPYGPCVGSDVCQTPTNPFIADSTWTVTNNSGADLDDVFLIFTRVSLAEGYPDIPVALDGNRVQILEYTSAGQEYYFAMIALGDLLTGESTQFTMRYIVGGNMPFSGNTQLMPPLGVYGLTGVPVPEPTTVTLLAAGLVALAMAKRKTA